MLILGTICAWVLDPGAGFCSGDNLRYACRLCRFFTAACFCHVIDRDPARNPEAAEPVPEDEASLLACPGDDHAREAGAEGYPEPDD